ncbi:MAG TPA: hypothetical protein VFA04_04780 [Bryobacteraceae bacterium]|jgi:hypothetical protein|nr:hypothetical protein [Bryobacteraceae bacterium]
MLRVSIQRALVGEVTDRLEAVTCGLKDRLIEIRAYFRGAVSQQDTDRIQSIGAEVIADFPEGYMIEEHSLSADQCEPQMLDFWAFRRTT